MFCIFKLVNSFSLCTTALSILFSLDTRAPTHLSCSITYLNFHLLFSLSQVSLQFHVITFFSISLATPSSLIPPPHHKNTSLNPPFPFWCSFSFSTSPWFLALSVFPHYLSYKHGLLILFNITSPSTILSLLMLWFGWSNGFLLMPLGQ